jgi:hypothetical protein
VSSRRRGRGATILILVVVVGALAYAMVYLGSRAPSPAAAGNAAGNASGDGSAATPSPPPTLCPLTGLDPSGRSVPIRPALAVKVENLPAARPQTGLSWADIVYEEPVEAWITRFIAVYQCQDAGRIEPVRSARLTDPDILDQFGRPLFGYAGAVPEVVAKVHAAGLIDVNFNMARASDAYHRDPDRSAPHNLYTSTAGLYASVKGAGGPPQPVFAYSSDVPRGPRIGTIHLPFSGYSDVYWRYSSSSGRYLRWHGTQPHTLSDGSQVSSRNVVVQVVRVAMTDITDANGARSPEVVATGSGKAYVFRDGRMVVGRWIRPHLSDVTKFVDDNGTVIPLAPGNTWVELLPQGIPVTAS